MPCAKADPAGSAARHVDHAKIGGWRKAPDSALARIGMPPIEWLAEDGDYFEIVEAGDANVKGGYSRIARWQRAVQRSQRARRVLQLACCAFLNVSDDERRAGEAGA